MIAPICRALRSRLPLAAMFMIAATATPTLANSPIAANLTPNQPQPLLLDNGFKPFTPVGITDDDFLLNVTDTREGDPLDSPYPVPWSWIVRTQQDYAEQKRSGLRYYRSPALVSPSGQYAAYSRIEVRAEPNSYESKVLGVMFIENLATGKLQVVRASSPIASYLQKVGEDSPEMAGVISILLPASWSEEGDRLLARQMEGAFNSSDISDYGVVWQGGGIRTLSAMPKTNMEFSATLLGWHQGDPHQVLFQVSHFDQEEDGNSLVSVALDGKVQPARAPAVIAYGKRVSRSWSGVQSMR
ncbi:hypothetical protein [Synechocystis sp. PCC 7338]|uniref:hypothetical protein n=1 Tax=Synechocystis sp. PCC 7338 TaxID=2732530 RepID=UPI001BAFB167|nr:hypothetical protein [Synechocystis sp. PCC 7338]QUS61876.1 hypothetical protein HTZ78_15215 [Synechocystis sp. PCC 7338]